MSKQVGQMPYQELISGGAMSNGLKDHESSNAFDIRIPDSHNYNNYEPNNNNNNSGYDVFSDKKHINIMLGNDLAGLFDDGATTNPTHYENNNIAMTTNTNKNLENIWSSTDGNFTNNNYTNNNYNLSSSSHSSNSDFSSAFTPFSNNEGLGFLRRSSSNNGDLDNNCIVNNNIKAVNNVIGCNSNNNINIQNLNLNNNNVLNNNNNNIIGGNNSKNNIVQQDNSISQPSLNNNNNKQLLSKNKSENLSSKMSSGVESPATLPSDPNNPDNANNTSENAVNNPNNNLGFLETNQLMHERINSNEGWGKKTIRQDTPWVLEGSMYAGRREDLDTPAQPTPQPEIQGPFWDQNTRISNCSESDRNFGVWTEPGRNNSNIAMGGASGVGLWKTNLNMGGKPDIQPPTPQQPQLPPHLFQQQQQQQQPWNATDPRLLLAAVAQRLSEEDQSKPKWSSSSSTSSSNIINQPWEDKILMNSHPPNPNNPWNSSQRMEGMQGGDINPALLQQLLSHGKFPQNPNTADLLGKAKGFGGVGGNVGGGVGGGVGVGGGGGGGSSVGGFDGTRGRPLFAQKVQNTAPSPLPHSFNPPPPNLNPLLHSNIFSPQTNSNPPMPPFNSINPQDNALKAQLLMVLQQQQQQQHQQQQQQQHQQQQQQQMQHNNNNNNADLSAMMMMMMNEAKAGGDASKDMLSQLISNMRMDGRGVPGFNNNNMPNNDNWNLSQQQQQDESSFFSNNNMGGGGVGVGAHMFNNHNNIRLPGWQNNKMGHPNTANIAYNWLFIKNFSGDPPSLHFIGSQNRAMKYFGGSHSNSVLIYFPSTEDAMKAKAQFAMTGMLCELFDNNTANRELSTGMWTPLPPAPHHHQPFMPRPPLGPGAMWPPVRY